MICLSCKKIYRPHRSGVYFEELMPLGREPNVQWVSYKLWAGDLLKCPGCGHEIIAGIPLRPVAEHYMPKYQEILMDLTTKDKVIAHIPDCGNFHGGDMFGGEIHTLRQKAKDYDKLTEFVNEITEEIVNFSNKLRYKTVTEEDK